MNVQSHAVFTAALALPEVDRVALVEQLLETLSPNEAELSEDELAAELDRRREELDRRREEVERGAEPKVPWSELKRES